MYFSGNQLLLYAVTDRGWLKPGETLTQQVESALKGGVTMVQLREKELPREQFLQQAREILPLCRRFDVPLIINDDAQLALEVGADGVHIGQDDMAYEKARPLLGPEKIIGVSAHNPREALAAQEAGADYLGCGAVFGSTTKGGVQTLTPAGLKAICEQWVPVVAIGGINERNLSQLKGCGAYGAAVISAIFAKEDKQAAAQELAALAKEVFSPVPQHENRPHHCRLRFQRRRRHPSGHQNHDGPWCLCHERHYRSHRPKHHRRLRHFGIHPRIFEAAASLCIYRYFPRCGQNRHGKQRGPDSHYRPIAKRVRRQNIVLDPVMVSTSGSRLLAENASQALLTELAPLADMITPNIPEGEVLSGMKIRSKQDMEQAARIISEKFSGAILLKGGHLADTSDDLLYVDGQSHWFTGRHIPNPNTHGTGCTLSSAIASCLALGFSLPESVQRAKNYVAGALFDGLDLGHGSGPLNHGYRSY